jgi:hypothetical protein
MDVQPGIEIDLGNALIAAHCRSLDPATPKARERLAEALGPELAGRLVFALAPLHARERRTARAA